MKRLVLLAVLALAGCGGGGGAAHFDVQSRLLDRTVREAAVIPAGKTRGRPVLFLLHGRSSKPEDLATRPLRDAVRALGARAPIVVLVNGGDHSYYHDRAEGRWGSHVLHEVIPTAIKRFNADGSRVAIGGISMGGFGALDIARLAPTRFCAVGAHSAALWDSGGETPAGAFDDADDFARHDIIGAARANPDLYGTARVWIDVGRDDPFRTTDTELAGLLRGERFHLWPGGHGPSYWNAHMSDYLAFYANALATCH